MWHKHGVPARPPSSRTQRRALPPLDAAALERLALRYVERFATTRGKLVAYLGRKVRERGWEGEPADMVALAARFASLGYVDDRGYADGKAASLVRRGYGARRVSAALHAAHVGEEDRVDAVQHARDAARESALVLARRRRIGPFAAAPADPRERERQLAVLLRAGHELTLARRIVNCVPGKCPEDD